MFGEVRGGTACCAGFWKWCGRGVEAFFETRHPSFMNFEVNAERNFPEEMNEWRSSCVRVNWLTIQATDLQHDRYRYYWFKNHDESLLRFFLSCYDANGLLNDGNVVFFDFNCALFQAVLCRGNQNEVRSQPVFHAYHNDSFCTLCRSTLMKYELRVIRKYSEVNMYIKSHMVSREWEPCMK